LRWLISGQAVVVTRRACAALDRSEFAGFRFPAEVITVAVRWYLRYGLSYRDVERSIEVDHVSVYRWVQRFATLLVSRCPAVSTCPGGGGLSMRSRRLLIHQC
jgi:hypothetical protein